MIMEKERNRGEVVLYQPNDTIRLEVKLEQETVWLTQQQIAMLMGTNVPAISKHIANIYSTKELNKTATVSKMEIVRVEGSRLVKRSVDHYNLDMIISVGYRVNSVNATAFRRWASTILKQYLLRGYSINQQLIQMEDRIDRRLESQHDEIQRIKEIQEKQQSQIDFFVRTSLPPVEGIFFDGQMWDAYELISKLIKSARQRIILIDNYVDDSVLTLLDKRTPGVTAEIGMSTIIGMSTPPSGAKRQRASARRPTAVFASAN